MTRLSQQSRSMKVDNKSRSIPFLNIIHCKLSRYCYDWILNLQYTAIAKTPIEQQYSLSTMPKTCCSCIDDKRGYPVSNDTCMCGESFHCLMRPLCIFLVVNTYPLEGYWFFSLLVASSSSLRSFTILKPQHTRTSVPEWMGGDPWRSATSLGRDAFLLCGHGRL